MEARARSARLLAMAGVLWAMPPQASFLWRLVSCWHGPRTILLHAKLQKQVICANRRLQDLPVTAQTLIDIWCNFTGPSLSGRVNTDNPQTPILASDYSSSACAIRTEVRGLYFCNPNSRLGFCAQLLLSFGSKTPGEGGISFVR